MNHSQKIVLIGLLTIVSLAANALAQTTPKTVTDYLLALPPAHFQLVHPGFQYEKPQPKTKAQMDDFRRSRIAIEDIKNGFIKYTEVPADGDLDWTEIALFKKSSGGYVMAIARSVFYKGCDTTLDFLEYNGGSWFKVTKRYSPKLTPAMEKKTGGYKFCFQLPEEGRTLRAYSRWYDEPEKTVGEFEWNGERFVVKR